MSRSRHEEPAHDVLAAEAFEMPAADPALHVEKPHDVLAAEEFGMPAADPALHAESPHDVLAAEAFEMPAADPELLAAPRAVPADPSGRPEPHDVLAADEFPMPAVRSAGKAASERVGRGSLRVALGLGIAAALALRAARRRG